MQIALTYVFSHPKAEKCFKTVKLMTYFMKIDFKTNQITLKHWNENLLRLEADFKRKNHKKSAPPPPPGPPRSLPSKICTLCTSFVSANIRGSRPDVYINGNFSPFQSVWRAKMHSKWTANSISGLHTLRKRFVIFVPKSYFANVCSKQCLASLKHSFSDHGILLNYSFFGGEWETRISFRAGEEGKYERQNHGFRAHWIRM